MFGCETGALIFFVSLTLQVMAWIAHRMRQQHKRANERSVILHLAKKGWFWNPRCLAYIDAEGKWMTDEQIHEAMKDFI